MNIVLYTEMAQIVSRSHIYDMLEKTCLIIRKDKSYSVA